MSDGNPVITITIHLLHGEPIRARINADAARLLGVSDDLEKATHRNSMSLVLDGKLLLIPFANIRLVEIDPAPPNLPVWLLQGDRI
ncbi:MAG: hypothetical protein A3H91_03570 [Gammaproteobacteria bacterium RIFCSPLOWO2_02_FULL_61_13]|nr:MAG: hypothetical protein A3H91_03570 [Gammaproteobacteria bacterium RIFCSPLOWO2_02_FULL_61_13]